MKLESITKRKQNCFQKDTPMQNDKSRSDLEDFVLKCLPQPPRCDFVLCHKGGFVTLRAISPAGKRYAARYLPFHDPLRIERATAVPLADIADVLQQIQEHNLTVGGGIA